MNTVISEVETRERRIQLCRKPRRVIRLHLPRIANHGVPCQHSRFREIIGLRRDDESPTNSEAHGTCLD